MSIFSALMHVKEHSEKVMAADPARATDWRVAAQVLDRACLHAFILLLIILHLAIFLGHP